MLDETMQIRDGDKLLPLVMNLSGSEPPPMVFQFWMAELARDMLRLGIYFRTVGIMLQIPGGAEYEWVGDDEDDENDAATWELVRATDQNALLNVLAECLDRLGVKGLMEQVPAPDYEPEALSDEWEALLDKRAKVKNGLLTVVAECLDTLAVRPGMAEIDQADEPHWWQRWRPHP